MFKNRGKNINALNESLKYIANSFVRFSQDGEGNVIGVTSSLDCSVSKLDICGKICSKITNKGLSSFLIDVNRRSSENIYKEQEFKSVICKDNILVNELVEIINDVKTKNDIVLVNIPCIIISADAVEYARVCDRITLVEKYMYSKYKDFEDGLEKLKSNQIKVDGVVTF